MMKRITAWRETKRKEILARREDGDTFIFYIMLFPVMFAFFGLSIDVGASAYTANSLQSALDTAAQSTVSQSSNTLFGPTLNITKTQQQLYRLYDMNRSSPFTACQGKNGLSYSATAAVYQINPPSGCGFSVDNVSLNTSAIVDGKTVRNIVNIRVTEYSKTLFIGMLGFDYQKYNLSSKAYLTTGQGL